MRTNWVKKKLLEGQTVVGTMMCEFATTGIPRIAAEAGADFAVYDLEVSGWTMETIRILMASSRPDKMVPLVRIPVIEDHFISRALDLGAMGLAIPQVETEEQAQTVVAWAKYPPEGRRNVCFGIAQDDYSGGDIVEKMAAFNRETLLVAHIENVAGLNNADRIAGVDGIDVIWIGQYDLTVSLGIPGQFQNPVFLRAADRVVEACHRHGKAAGFGSLDLEELASAPRKGYRFLVYVADLWIYQQALADGVSRVRKSLQAQNS